MTDETSKKARRPKWGEPGSRVIRRTQATVFSAGARRPVIVCVYPDGVIGLRLNKQRREEFALADDIYREACAARVRFEREKKRKAKGKR